MVRFVGSCVLLIDVAGVVDTKIVWIQDCFGGTTVCVPLKEVSPL